MSDPRKHHYVPQTYLKNFCIPYNNKPNKLWVYDKVNQTTYISDINKIAVEKDFYKLSSKSDQFYWEHYYSFEVESKYPQIISRLISACMLTVNGVSILSKELKDELSFIMLTQLLRTKKARENQTKIGTKAASEKLEELRISLIKYMNTEQKEWLDKFEITDSFIKENELLIINDSERLEKFKFYFLNRYWIIYYNRIADTTPFITSDHPVCYFNVRSKSTSYIDNGLAVQSTVIFFPISSKVLIGLYPRGLYFGGLEGLDGQKIVVDEVEFISQINYIQAIQCYRQIYSSKG